MPLLHRFSSSIPDMPDATLIRPSNWNDTHTVSGSGAGEILFVSGTDISSTSSLKFVTGVLVVSGTVSASSYQGLPTASIPSSIISGSYSVVANTSSHLASFVSGSVEKAFVDPSGSVFASGVLLPDQTVIPTVPVSGAVFSNMLGGSRRSPLWRATGSFDRGLQYGLFDAGISWITCVGGASTGFVNHRCQVSVGGSVAGKAQTDGALLNVTSRVAMTTTASPGQVSSVFSGQTKALTSATATLGGYYFQCRFGIVGSMPSASLFVGFRASVSGFTNVDTSTLTNIVCLGTDQNDANLQIMYNDTVGTASKIDLGGSWPKSVTNGYYDFRLFNPPGGGQQFSYWLQRLDTGASISGTVTGTDMPANGQTLAPSISVCNRGAAVNYVVDFVSLYVETET